MTQTSRVLSALLLCGAWGAAQAAPVISPYADDLPFASYSADQAAGGTSAQSVFNGGYWNAGTWGTHWVQADMGASYTLSEVRLTVDVMPATTTSQWVFLSDTPIGWNYGALTPVIARSGYTTKFQTFDLSFAPTAGRYLQIVSNGGGSWTALGDWSSRSDWVDPTSVAPPAVLSSVPEPETTALMLAGLSVLGFASQRRQRG
jgi:hypothetical protein